MPKITVHGGATNAATDEAPVSEPDTRPQSVKDLDELDEIVAVANADTEPAAEAVDYTAFTVEDLKAELKGRDLSTSGNKAELVDRLVADDTKAAD